LLTASLKAVERYLSKRLFARAEKSHQGGWQNIERPSELQNTSFVRHGRGFSVLQKHQNHLQPYGQAMAFYWLRRKYLRATFVDI